MSWLQGFQKIAWNHTPGIPTNRPARAIVFHTTEGGTESGAFSVYGQMQACPHFTVNPDTQSKYQHVDTDLGAYDTSVGLTYQGQWITPVALRVYGITWPVRQGMGVVFRDGAGTLTDLTDWVEWEEGDVTLDVGGYARTALGSVGASGSPQLASAVDDGRWTAFTPQFDQGASTNITKTVNSARWRRIGSTIHVEVDVSFTAGGSAGSGLTMTVPVDFAHSGIGHKGVGFIYDASATQTYKPVVLRTAASKVVFKDSGTDVFGVVPNVAVANGDLLTCSLSYEGTL